MIWLVYIVVRVILGKPALPQMHFRVLVIPGTISGILWSLGNFCALYSVLFLGIGIGNSAVQVQAIVAGLWGILYYKEVQGIRILIWLFFLMLALGGIAGMSLMQYFGQIETNSTLLNITNISAY